jgi:hypothetical protein
VDLEGVGGSPGRTITPQGVDEPIAGDHPVGPEQEGGEKDALASPAKRDRVPIVVEEFQWSE